MSTTLFWTSLDIIVDLVGVAQVYYYKRGFIAKSFFLVDKYDCSETDASEQVLDVGLALSYAVVFLVSNISLHPRTTNYIHY